ncbi:MAG: hypothetical protein AAF356_01275 [Planctomycetota bacterium]
MLKFLRKYQFIILVIGGTLLMIIFLLEPVLTRLQPDPSKRQVATIGVNNSKVSDGDLRNATSEVRAVTSLAPWLAGASGLGLDPDREADHWFLLTHEAERGGFIGETGDGPGLIPQLASDAATLQALSQAQQQFPGNPQIQRLILSQPQTQEQIAVEAARVEAAMMQAVPRIAGQLLRGSPEMVYEALAKVRGVQRMTQFYQTAPRASEREAIAATKRSLDAVVADALVIPGAAFAGEIETPTDAQLAAHLERFGANRPGEGEFGIGYTLPPRIKLEWLTIDPGAIRGAIRIGRIDANKHWQQNRDRFPGEFSAERVRVENELAEAEAERLVEEIDRIIRAEVLRSTQGLDARGGRLVLPSDWDERRPSAEARASAVVEQAAERLGIAIERPVVNVRAASWLTGGDLQTLPGIGGATYRVGSIAVPAAALPQVVVQTGITRSLVAQPGVPLVDPPAVDALGRRHYVTILESRDESPAESVEEAGRERVLRDYYSLRGYELLIERFEQLVAEAAAGGLDELAAVYASPATDVLPAIQPTVAERIAFRRDGVQTPDAAINAEPVRSAVIEAGEARMGPTAEPDTLEGEAAFVVAGDPSRRSVVIARLSVRRPATETAFRGYAVQAVRDAALRDYREDDGSAPRNYPFTFDSLAERLNYRRTDADGDAMTRGDQVDEPAPDAEPESEPESQPDSGS